MKNIKIEYEYDGSEFMGFQRQPNLRTVQGELERCLKVIFKNDINLISAGRTDRGVHAKMQVSNFFSEINIPIIKLKDILNNILPKDITIKNITEVSNDFSARYSAKYRAYEYYITKKRSSFNSRYTTFYDIDFDIDRLNKIATQLKGRYDFKNFRLTDCTSKTTIREIYEANFSRIDDDTIKFYVKGNAFLKSQIRIFIGSIVAEYMGKKPEGYISKMLDNSSNIEYSKIVADPNGLFLAEIGY